MTGMRVHPDKTKTNFACTVRVRERKDEREVGGQAEDEDRGEGGNEEEQEMNIEPAELPVLVRNKELGRRRGREGGRGRERGGRRVGLLIYPCLDRVKGRTQ